MVKIYFEIGHGRIDRKNEAVFASVLRQGIPAQSE